MTVRKCSYGTIVLFILIASFSNKTVKHLSRNNTGQEHILDRTGFFRAGAKNSRNMRYRIPRFCNNNHRANKNEIGGSGKAITYLDPKLRSHTKRMSNTIEGMLNLHKMIKNSRDVKIRFHIQKSKHVKTKEKVCFEESLLMTLEEYKKYIPKHNISDDWFFTYFISIINRILKYMSNLQEVASKFGIKNVSKAMIETLHHNDKLLRLIINIDNDYLFEENLTAINKNLEDLIAANLIRFDHKYKNIKRILALKPFLRNLLLNEYIPIKTLKMIQDETYKRHIDTVIDFIQNNKNVLFVSIEVQPGTKDNIVSSIIEALMKDNDLQIALSYFIHIKNFKGNLINSKCNKISILIKKTIFKAISMHKGLGKEAIISIYNNFIFKFEKLFILKDQLLKNTLNNYKTFIYRDILTSVFKSLQSSRLIKQAELKKIFKLKILNEIIEEEYNLTPSTVYEISDDNAYKENYVNFVKKILGRFFSMKKLKAFPSIDYDKLYHNATQKIFKLIDSIKFIPDASGSKQRCLFMRKSTLATKYVLNKQKFKYCRSALANLENVNINEISQLLDEMQKEFINISELKQTAYCTLYDKKFKLLKETNKFLFKLSQAQCKQVIPHLSKYFELKEKIFNDYQSKLIQYIQCFITDGNANRFYNNIFDHSQLALSRQFNNCISAYGEQKRIACNKVCDKLNLANFSEFFVGEKASLQVLHDFIFNASKLFNDTREIEAEVLSSNKNYRQPKIHQGRILEEKTSESDEKNERGLLMREDEAYFNSQDHYEKVSNFYKKNGIDNLTNELFDTYVKHNSPKGRMLSIVANNRSDIEDEQKIPRVGLDIMQKKAVITTAIKNVKNTIKTVMKTAKTLLKAFDLKKILKRRIKKLIKKAFGKIISKLVRLGLKKIVRKVIVKVVRRLVKKHTGFDPINRIKKKKKKLFKKWGRKRRKRKRWRRKRKRRRRKRKRRRNKKRRRRRRKGRGRRSKRGRGRRSNRGRGRGNKRERGRSSSKKRHGRRYKKEHKTSGPTTKVKSKSDSNQHKVHKKQFASSVNDKLKDFSSSVKSNKSLDTNKRKSRRKHNDSAEDNKLDKRKKSHYKQTEVVQKAFEASEKAIEKVKHVKRKKSKKQAFINEQDQLIKEETKAAAEKKEELKELEEEEEQSTNKQEKISPSETSSDKQMTENKKQIKNYITQKEAAIEAAKKKKLQAELEKAKLEKEFAEAVDSAIEAKEKAEMELKKTANNLGIKPIELKLKLSTLYIQKIKMIKSELKDDIRKRRIKRYYVTELTHASINYDVRGPFVDLRQFKSKYASEGVDPLKLVQNVNFETDVLQKFIKNEKDVSSNEEELKPEALGVYLSINESEINMFNNDISDITFDPGIPKKVKETELKMKKTYSTKKTRNKSLRNRKGRYTKTNKSRKLNNFEVLMKFNQPQTHNQISKTYTKSKLLKRNKAKIQPKTNREDLKNSSTTSFKDLLLNLFF